MIYWDQYLSMVDSFQLKLLIGLTIAYFVLCVIVAIKERKFRFAILTNTLDKALIPIYGGLAMVALVSLAQPAWESLLPSMWVTLDAMIVGLGAAKAKALGLPIPNIPWLGVK